MFWRSSRGRATAGPSDTGRQGWRGSSRGGTSLTAGRGFRQGRIEELSDSDDDDTLPSQARKLSTLKASDIVPVANSVQMKDARVVASYNWLDRRDPTILVPGCPPAWSPPATTRQLQPDAGEVFIDQHNARHPSYPMEPLVRSLVMMQPLLDLGAVEVVICRNTLNKLLDFVLGGSKTFEFEIEVLGGTTFFIRKEKYPTEHVTGFQGFGNTFPKEYTKWDPESQGSSSHHRVARCDFGGLSCLIRFESKSYQPSKAGESKIVQRIKKTDVESAETDATPANAGLSSLLAFKLSDEEHPVVGSPLEIQSGGREIDQAAMMEIKTRGLYRGLDIQTVLPSLWLSQTPNLVIALHSRDVFTNIDIHDLTTEIAEWETREQLQLKKLNAVLRRLIQIAKETKTKKCLVRKRAVGGIQIYELPIDERKVLPEDLCKLWDPELDRGSASEGSRRAESVRDQIYESEEDEDRYGDCHYDGPNEDEAEDFAACSLDDCGYCGHCPY
ncbi:MAG: hypothetical protein M1817_003562 [Caeruleum heppii]|nr:MAG: hypothetical protein M1817_003562 [Caeruleum heppii]